MKTTKSSIATGNWVREILPTNIFIMFYYKHFQTYRKIEIVQRILHSHHQDFKVNISLYLFYHIYQVILISEAFQKKLQTFTYFPHTYFSLPIINCNKVFNPIFLLKKNLKENTMDKY